MRLENQQKYNSKKNRIEKCSSICISQAIGVGGGESGGKNQ